METSWIPEEIFKTIEHEVWENVEASKKSEKESKISSSKVCALKEVHRNFNWDDLETELIG